MSMMHLRSNTNGLVHEVTSGVTIGRDESNDIVLDNVHVSRFHSKIRVKAGHFFVKDLRSKNGTYLNSIQITNETKVKHGDVISFGSPQESYFAEISDDPASVSSGIRQPVVYALVFSVLLLSVVIGAFSSIYSNNKHIKSETSSNEPVANGTVTDSIPQVEADVIRAVLIRLGEKAEYIDEEIITLVSSYIAKYRKGKTYSERMREMKNYEEIIYAVLDSHTLSRDYIYIAFVESGFNPLAYNRYSGARGMWQLMKKTAISYGLQVTKRVDERTDVTKSTAAACKYISDMAAIFGYDSFLLIAASFNCGDGALRAALKQIQNVKDNRSFFYLYRNTLIPDETGDYVLKIIAAIVLVEMGYGGC